jgi:surfactin synthase thioesterase subunit
VLRGVDDREVSRADAEAWQVETASSFELHDLPGGHFFPFENPGQFVTLLQGAVEGEACSERR